MTIVEFLQAVIALQRLLDTIIRMAAEHAKAKDLVLLDQAISEARTTRTSEGKREAAKKMRAAISGDGGSSRSDSGNDL